MGAGGGGQVEAMPTFFEVGLVSYFLSWAKTFLCISLIQDIRKGRPPKFIP